MGANAFLLRRYVLPRRGNLLSMALWISVAGVAIGITQLMVVLSVMSGFQRFLQDRYTRITSEIIVLPKGMRPPDPSFRPAIEGTKGVLGVTPFGLGQAMLMKEGVAGAVLEGVDLDTSAKVTPWEEIWTARPSTEVQEKNRYWIWLGAQLAKKLKAQVGDTVNVMVADGSSKRILPFLVSAITKFGIYDHDLHYARVDLRVLNELFVRQPVEPMYKLRLSAEVSAEGTAERLREAMGGIALVKLWSEVNQNIFLAVQHQKKMLFLVLEIVVALAAMNVVNLLMMSSYHRRRDIAILRAMGMRLGSVLLFFIAQGAAVGIAGIVLGVGLGFAACRFVERFQPEILSEAIYNVTRLPLRVEVADVFLVSVVAFVLCLVFSLLPAFRSAWARPVDALRYE